MCSTRGPQRAVGTPELALSDGAGAAALLSPASGFFRVQVVRHHGWPWAFQGLAEPGTPHKPSSRPSPWASTPRGLLVCRLSRHPWQGREASVGISR